MKSSRIFIVGQSALRRIAATMALMLLSALAQAQDNPVVRVSTTYGDFSIELFQDQTPETVANFLGYVNRGDYRRTFIHRAQPDFVVQGGGFRFVPGCTEGVRPCGPMEIPTRAPVVNEPGISNTRGTLAMAKLGDDPDSATSQWFVNLQDNSENLDEQNGGFSVFGQVLGDGMDVVDRIGEQENYNLCDTQASCYATDIPLRDFENFNLRFPVDQHFIHINPTPVSRFSSNLHVFEHASGLLITTVDGGEDLGVFSLRLQLVPDGQDIIFELLPDTMIPLGVQPETSAVWNPETGRLEVSRVELNSPDGSVDVITDLEFSLLSEEPMRFVLESWQQP